VEPHLSDPIPTRWVTQIRGQLADADRRMGLAERRAAEGDGGRALQEAYPGVMAAALAKVWIADEAWHRTRTMEEYGRMVRAELPSPFVTLGELTGAARGFSGWRVEDARPLLQEARAFIGAVHADLDRRLGPPPTGEAEP
jgi:hypothetical protein